MVNKMTNEEAVEILKEEHNWVQEPYYVIKAIELAIDALKGHIGEPLTTEQLRGMEKPTPVFAKLKKKTIEAWDGYWCICHRGHIIAPGMLSMYADKMNFVTFYAYPPVATDTDVAFKLDEWTAEWIKRDGYTECSKCEHWYDSPENEDDGDRPAFCPSCGRAMKPESWAMLKKRFMG